MRTILALLSVLLLAACGSRTQHQTLPMTDAPYSSPSTTVAPASSNELFCQFATAEGPYYVQVFNLTVPGKGMCTGTEMEYTQEQFRAIPGLKRRCNLDRDEQIKQKHAIVSIYSDESEPSIASARLMCSNTGNEFTE